MARDPTDGKAKLVQVMAWCRQATSHWLNQCWQISTMQYVLPRPQRVNQSTQLCWQVRKRSQGIFCEWYSLSCSTRVVDYVKENSLHKVPAIQTLKFFVFFFVVRANNLLNSRVAGDLSPLKLTLRHYNNMVSNATLLTLCKSQETVTTIRNTGNRWIPFTNGR